MNAPICEFLAEYVKKQPVRLHMPGHKGKNGFEKFDITEIPGADSLYEANGVIAQSEKNASRLFGTHATFYSTEGSSHCIRAMVYIALLQAKSAGRECRILAYRNAHRTFAGAAAALGVECEWLFPHTSPLSCDIPPEETEKALENGNFTALYVTSPDYLGGMCDIAALSDVCRRRGVLLLVDNAHGAYLNFLPQNRHPVALGADVCCDSAHKTLPVLTGGAYLHFSESAAQLAKYAKSALALFGSTSPSYLILRSLDAANVYISEGYSGRLADFAKLVSRAKEKIARAGYGVYGEEPLKITVMPKRRGMTGRELARECEKQNIFCDFADEDFTVFMLTPENSGSDLDRLCELLLSLPVREKIATLPPRITPKKRAVSMREALLSDCETVPVREALGRICASPLVGCPPAVPITVCGELIDENAIEVFEYFGIDRCSVVK